MASIADSNKIQLEYVLDGTLKVFTWLQRLSTLSLVLYAISMGIYKGIQTNTISGFITWLLGGGLVAIGAILFHLILNIVFGVWDKSSDWLTGQFKKYPKIRRWVIIPFSAMIGVSTFVFILQYWYMDTWLKIVLFFYFGLTLPSALISIVREDVRRERTYLARYKITPELIAQNPQAAIEHAFTLFEDHLRKRLDVGPDVYGENLINQAFRQNGRLVYGELENESAGTRNLISGAYATFRNPRKHRVIEDDEEITLAIISLVELLIRLVDESKDRSPTP